MRLSTAAAFGASDKGWGGDDGRPRGLAAQVDRCRPKTTDKTPKQRQTTPQNYDNQDPKTMTGDTQRKQEKMETQSVLCKFPGLAHEARHQPQNVPKQQQMTQNKNRRRHKTTTSDGQNNNIRHRKERALLCRFPGLVHEARGLGTLCAINCRSTQTRDR